MSRAPWYAKTYKNNNFIDMLNRNKRLTWCYKIGWFDLGIVSI